MASAGNTHNSECLSDEAWLISQSKGRLANNVYEARAWLLVARTLFPRNFMFQYEAYQIEKSKKNVKEVAKLIEEMLRSFPGEPQLWAEIQLLTDALQSDGNTPWEAFLRDCFCSLPSSLQCHILLRITETTPDVLQRCKLMLLILNRHPEQVPEHGIKLIESLISAEKQMQQSGPVNGFRKYLVCDVLPVVLTCSLPHIGHKHLYRWLQKSIEFYVSFVTQPQSPDDAQTPTNPELLSPTLKSGSRRVSISGLPPSQSVISNPWKQLLSLLELFAGHFGWQITDYLTHARSGSEDKEWHSLQCMSEAPISDSGSLNKQLLYTASVSLLHHVYKYTVRAMTHLITGSSSNQHLPLVLIEPLKPDKAEIIEHKHKKLKLESGVRRVECSESVGRDVTQSLVTAVRCWELIHSHDAMQREFTKFGQHWQPHTWAWLSSFEVDYLIYQGQFKDACAKLRAGQSLPRGPHATLRSDIQLACCYYCLANYSRACELSLGIVSSLPPGGVTSRHAESEFKGRHLRLLVCNEAEILPCLVHIMISCFREKAFKYAMPNDMALGHMLVLMQYDWATYQSLFTDVIDKIIHQATFTYSPFFNYIVNIDILEEFAELRNHVSLDILPTSTKTLTQSRTVTRGVNKGVNEDFRAALDKQVARTNDDVHTLVKLFLVDERDLLRQSLL